MLEVNLRFSSPFSRYAYAVTSTSCPNDTMLYSRNEKCQNEDKADTVDEGDSTDCYIEDIDDECSSQAFAWEWDVKSLKWWGKFRIIVSICCLFLCCCIGMIQCYQKIMDDSDGGDGRNASILPGCWLSSYYLMMPFVRCYSSNPFRSWLCYISDDNRTLRINT